ncbi:hypothetical protein SAMN02745664_101118 [Moraxella cuniculi DSM 21768]|uniref:Outer membrane protein G1b n=1 Tax=Moraxella cuniculi DSM 21768 TaxID=1122245 RepID=A0A1N7DAG4_9GAMM|nr:hypothetical protein [Moraxella cuniculi]OOS07936.1 hypothetical protein B0189_00875 [Moraxella cuniculi]SIR72725.1 hypothetical protein SAMN02745664_101118 [Moraxella cuniculi DSM 21768]
MKAVKLSVISAAVLLSTSAMANVITNTGTAVANGTRTVFKTLTKPAAVSAEVGTLGYGANIAWAVNDTTELQAGWAGGDIAKSINDNFDANGVNYQLDTDFSNPYIGVQMRPAANWFTVGAGIIVPDNDIKVRANSYDQGVYRVGGKEYNQADVGVLEGTLEHRNKLAPYLTIGFRPNINNNWGVFGEIGATYLGKVDAQITADETGLVRATDGTVTSKRAIAVQAERDIEAKKYANWFPIAKVGVTYRF